MGAEVEISVDEKVAFDLVTERASFANLLRPKEIRIIQTVFWSDLCGVERKLCYTGISIHHIDFCIMP